MMLPHFIVLSILQNIFENYQDSSSVKSFFKQFLLINKSWNQFIIPKLNSPKFTYINSHVPLFQFLDKYNIRYELEVWENDKFNSELYPTDRIITFTSDSLISNQLVETLPNVQVFNCNTTRLDWSFLKSYDSSKSLKKDMSLRFLFNGEREYSLDRQLPLYQLFDCKFQWVDIKNGLVDLPFNYFKSNGNNQSVKVLKFDNATITLSLISSLLEGLVSLETLELSDIKVQNPPTELTPIELVIERIMKSKAFRETITILKIHTEQCQIESVIELMNSNSLLVTLELRINTISINNPHHLLPLINNRTIESLTIHAFVKFIPGFTFTNLITDENNIKSLDISNGLYRNLHQFSVLQSISIRSNNDLVDSIIGSSLEMNLPSLTKFKFDGYGSYDLIHISAAMLQSNNYIQHLELSALSINFTTALIACNHASLKYLKISILKPLGEDISKLMLSLHTNTNLLQFRISKILWYLDNTLNSFPTIEQLFDILQHNHTLTHLHIPIKSTDGPFTQVSQAQLTRCKNILDTNQSICYVGGLDYTYQPIKQLFDLYLINN
ncbi:hypothetical protein DLAC_02928 [Tieghemostelium lacteum]|uniref:Uncharacterized protein n=1 Tax=Tieghemostelium lacteum TaxID=361077 RepID=A0A152A3T1_TIELA|nr:hypothetical protein DLAC_02928 [Tieghemostelium lacteum]|eukprot:KYR00870.1 hypothetical protein DLAC_02928 [Tieghemostelium lacteum]